MKTAKSEDSGAGVPLGGSQHAPDRAPSRAGGTPTLQPQAGATPTPQGRAGGTDVPQFSFVDPRDTPFVEPQSRGFLPHLYKDCGTYFVTFRLWDAVVPKEGRKTGGVEQRKRAGGTPKAQGQAGGTPALQERRPKTREEIAAEFEPPLRLGSCALGNPAVAAMVQNALKHFHGGRYYLHAWCVMPNHVHVVYTALPGHSPKDIHHSWNSYTAHQANKILTRSGTFWEAEGFDHLIRSIDDLQWFIEYTENNPVAAGLCRNKDDWRWSSAGSRWNPRAACGAGVRPAVSARTEAAGTAAPQQLAGETPAPQIWNERTFLQVQAVQLRELLRQAGDDPILVPQLSQRLADVEDELKALNSYRAAVSGVVSFAARGVFRGLTRESRIFDLVADDAKLITGTIAANLREEDLDRIAGLTNQRCLASLQKATFCQGGVWQESYLLLNVVRDDGGNG